MRERSHTAAGVLRLLAVLALGFGAAAFFAAGAFFGSAALDLSFFGALRFLGAAAFAAVSFFMQTIRESWLNQDVRPYLGSSSFLLFVRRSLRCAFFLC